jgi:hypothetical protein
MVLRVTAINCNKDYYASYFYGGALNDAVPISWNVEGKKLLTAFKLLLDNQLVSVHPSMTDLIIALRSATMENNWDLNKQASVNNDLLDATIAAARPFSYKRKPNV